MTSSGHSGTAASQVGITAVATHIPCRRLARETAIDAVAWYAPFLGALKKGTRSVCNYDEDALTMGVTAAMRCLDAGRRGRIEALFLAGTTLPFEDRLNGAIVKTALGLPETLFAADVTGTQRAGTTGVIAAADRVSRTGDPVLVVAADHRISRPASPDELLFGDGAAAVTLGREGLIAAFKGSHSITRDLVDHYRQRGAFFDYGWEERWIAAVGYEQLIPDVITGLLSKHNLSVDEIDYFVYPCPSTRTHAKIGAKLGISKEKMVDNLFDTVGETGVAHPLVMLAGLLETAPAGARIVVVGFGGGADALLLETTESVERYRPRRETRPLRELRSYTQFLAFRDLLSLEEGVRGEKPQKTALSALFRERETLLGLVGGRCDACGVPQFPGGEVCVNPNCRKPGRLKPYRFSRRRAALKTYTGDYLGPSPSPPNIYGMIEFEGGGRMMAELTDCALDEIQVGTGLTMMFRRRYLDPERGFTGYFWKAVPGEEVPS